MRPLDPTFLVAQAIVLFLGIGFHEYAHCKFADLAGDPTPRYYGRVTLNLTKHFEPIGTIFMVLSTLFGFGLGWGRPAPMNPSKMRNPRWDHFIAVIAGPLSNVLQAVVWAALLRFVVPAFGPVTMSSFPVLLCLLGVLTNLSLAVFNLIPFGPLDGHWLVGLLLPEKLGIQWFQFNRKIGTGGLFIVILLLNQLNLSPTRGPILSLARLLLGPMI